jgi:hexosaminidase
MKNLIVRFIVGSLLVISGINSTIYAQQSTLNIVPIPYEIKVLDGEFVLNPQTVLITNLNNHDLRFIAEELRSKIETVTTWRLNIIDSSSGDIPDANFIELRTTDNGTTVNFDPTTHPAITKSANEESYSLLSSETSIVISARQARGVFYGVQSFRQLLPAAFEADSYTVVPTGTRWVIPAVEIIDKPRFAYRGMHLDVGRHFMPVEFVKKYIDLLAIHKMNTFHWHLTEDQGWRIQIDAYPLLTEIGGFRDSTLIGNYGSGRYDDIRYGGFYTKAEIRDVVDYASKRFIIVIPEIELPGHASAALAAYPQFGCTDLDLKYKVQSTWGIFPEIFCPKEETFEFLTTVFDEVMELFPGPFIHVGGDEAMKDHWKVSQIAQDVMKREGLENEEELQSYFIHRIDDHLTNAGRRLLGWDEILEGGLAPNATVMSWRGEEGGIAAARLGHDAVMSPTGFAYFDYYQSNVRENEPIAIGGYLPLDKVYGYEPIPAELEQSLHHHILGAQGNVWTEYMKTPEKVEYMAFPRVSAMAEVGWSSKENRNYESFVYRLSYLLKRLDWMGINYRNPF